MVKYSHNLFISHLPICLTVLFISCIWYITMWSNIIKCNYTGNFSTDIVSTHTMIRNGNSVRMITYETTYNYCNKYNLTEYHFTPEIINHYIPPQTIELYETYFGGLYIFNILLLKVFLLGPILLLLTVKSFKSASDYSNYLLMKTNDIKKE